MGNGTHNLPESHTVNPDVRPVELGLIDSPADLLGRRLTTAIAAITEARWAIAEGQAPAGLPSLIEEIDAIVVGATALPGNSESFARRKLVSSLGFAILHLCTGTLGQALDWAMKAQNTLWTIQPDEE